MTLTTLPRPQDLALTVDQARVYAEAAQACGTRRVYAVGWADFQSYCQRHGFQPLPASSQAVALYATDLAQRCKPATIRLYLAAVAAQHKERGLDTPTGHEIVRRVLRGIVRTKGSAQVKKHALTLDSLTHLLLVIPQDCKGARDRALLLLGFAAALRRSEIAALRIEDLTFSSKGLVIRLQRSKTDQEGHGVDIAVPFVPNKSLCAARAVKEWLRISGLESGPLFHSFDVARKMLPNGIGGRDVANLIKSLAKKARLEGDFSGHSLRAGFATSAASAKASLDSIARTTRHRSVSVLMGYVRPAQVFDDCALTAVVA